MFCRELLKSRHPRYLLNIAYPSLISPSWTTEHARNAGIPGPKISFSIDSVLGLQSIALRVGTWLQLQRGGRSVQPTGTSLQPVLHLGSLIPMPKDDHKATMMMIMTRLLTPRDQGKGSPPISASMPTRILTLCQNPINSLYRAHTNSLCPPWNHHGEAGDVHVNIHVQLLQ